MPRSSLFSGKAGGLRVQGILTPQGGRAFEKWRHKMTQTYTETVGAPPAGGISDADVIEALARGAVETERALKQEAKRAKRLLGK